MTTERSPTLSSTPSRLKDAVLRLLFLLLVLFPLAAASEPAATDAFVTMTDEMIQLVDSSFFKTMAIIGGIVSMGFSFASGRLSSAIPGIMMVFIAFSAPTVLENLQQDMSLSAEGASANVNEFSAEGANPDSNESDSFSMLPIIIIFILPAVIKVIFDAVTNRAMARDLETLDELLQDQGSADSDTAGNPPELDGLSPQGRRDSMEGVSEPLSSSSPEPIEIEKNKRRIVLD